MKACVIINYVHGVIRIGFVKMMPSGQAFSPNQTFLKANIVYLKLNSYLCINFYLNLKDVFS